MDPVGFLSVWWSIYTGLRDPEPTSTLEWDRKCHHLSDLARRGDGPSADMLRWGIRKWTKLPRGLEGLQQGQTPNDSIPSPWPTHPWNGASIRDAPLQIALWRFATWPYLHETGRFKSEHLQWWFTHLWPQLPWETLLAWVRSGVTSALPPPPMAHTRGTLGRDPDERGPWPMAATDRFRILGDAPLHGWASHPPPSFYRRWQEYTLRMAAGGLLTETWSEYFPAVRAVAPNSRLVYHVEGSHEMPFRDPPLPWLTWTQILAEHLTHRGPPDWVTRHLPPSPGNVRYAPPPGEFGQFRTLVRPIVIHEEDGRERVASRTISLSQGLWWAVLWHIRDRSNSIPFSSWPT